MATLEKTQIKQEMQAPTLLPSNTNNSNNNYTYTDQSYEKSSFEVFNKWRSQQPAYLTDAIVQVQDKKQYPIHRVIMARACPWFQTHFKNLNNSSPFGLPASKMIVDVDYITSKGFEPILDYAYTGILKITPNNAADALIAASYLQCSNEVINICAKYYESINRVKSTPVNTTPQQNPLAAAATQNPLLNINLMSLLNKAPQTDITSLLLANTLNGNTGITGDTVSLYNALLSLTSRGTTTSTTNNGTPLTQSILSAISPSQTDSALSDTTSPSSSGNFTAGRIPSSNSSILVNQTTPTNPLLQTYQQLQKNGMIQSLCKQNNQPQPTSSSSQASPIINRPSQTSINKLHSPTSITSSSNAIHHSTSPSSMFSKTNMTMHSPGSTTSSTTRPPLVTLSAESARLKEKQNEFFNQLIRKKETTTPTSESIVNDGSSPVVKKETNQSNEVVGGKMASNGYTSVRRRTLHSDVPKPHECDICHSKFTRFHNLKQHIKLHSGIKPYQCEHCNKRFTRNYTLRLHKMKVCTPERTQAIRRPVTTTAPVPSSSLPAALITATTNQSSVSAAMEAISRSLTQLPTLNKNALNNNNQNGKAVEKVNDSDNHYAFDKSLLGFGVEEEIRSTTSSKKEEVEKEDQPAQDSSQELMEDEVDEDIEAGITEQEKEKLVEVGEE